MNPRHAHNKQMQSDFGKLRLPQPLMRGVMRHSKVEFKHDQT